MYREPATWHALMERLTEQFAPYVAAQAAAGADAIQLFDSWVGVLSVADYGEFVAPYSARVLAAAGVPTIHFGTGATTQLLAEMARAGGDAIGVDWRIPLDDAWTVVGESGGSRGTSSRRCCSARGSASRRRRSTSCAGRRPARATSSTSGTASCRRPIPMCSRGLPRSSTDSQTS